MSKVHSALIETPQGHAPAMVHSISAVLDLGVLEEYPSYKITMLDTLAQALEELEGIPYIKESKTKYYLLLTMIKYPVPYAADIEQTQTFKEAGWTRYYQGEI